MASRYEPSCGERPFDPARCATSVSTGSWGRRHQCRSAHRPDSEWCGAHAPEAVAARDATRDARWRARADEQAQRFVRAGLQAATVEQLREELRRREVQRGDGG